MSLLKPLKITIMILWIILNIVSMIIFIKYQWFGTLGLIHWIIALSIILIIQLCLYFWKLDDWNRPKTDIKQFLVIFFIFWLINWIFTNKTYQIHTNKEYLLKECWFNNQSTQDILKFEKKDIKHTKLIYKWCLKKLDTQRSILDENIKGTYIGFYEDWSLKGEKDWFTDSFKDFKEKDLKFLEQFWLTSFKSKNINKYINQIVSEPQSFNIQWFKTTINWNNENIRIQHLKTIIKE